MSVLLKRCISCEEYTLQDACPRCGAKAIASRPAKYSPEDHYGEYRRKLKQMDKAKATGIPTPPRPVPGPGAATSTPVPTPPGSAKKVPARPAANPASSAATSKQEPAAVKPKNAKASAKGS